jgi:uncharacterized protein (DUF697 family)
MDNPGQTILLIALFACILPMIVLAVLVIALLWFGKTQLERLASPDIAPLLEEYRAAIARDPNSRDEVVQKIIRRQAFRCAVIGFFTGLGGLFTLPIALPLDVLVSVNLQATMLKFIASVYGYEKAYDSKVATYMIMSGSGELTRMSINFLTRVIVRLFGRFFSRIIPFLGAFISAGVNYALARSLGQAAIGWYARRGQPPQPAGALA